MIVEYTRYKVQGQQAVALEEAYQRARSGLEQSPHCLSYELSRCLEDQSTFVLRIEWDSVEGHLEGFRKSPEFRAFFEAVKPFFNDIQEMRHYEVTAVANRKA
ncbi:antibiotic biosynthesis monooxygenase [Ktedonosporobacter rubrisoli]|uniref:Antibiotic biosynthesis monooxygenase n=1 Tax=Ktedonosporobacter rubrisoli TaxID=2509675 RepID=A0A4P6JQL3_KTERU|nr:antibiotic biosynthesis monooxygenase family protein [Ktedonosporobacter rubrisoli]QBD77584.1 antibiotic biosynthesis monooxygenase [Ktedonosporobacter rubrisoli]